MNTTGEGIIHSEKKQTKSRLGFIKKADIDPWGESI